MFQDGIYKELLTEKQYENCKKVVEETPEYIWGPSTDMSLTTKEIREAERCQDTLDDIYNSCILHVHERLKNEGFQIDELEEYSGSS